MSVYKHQKTSKRGTATARRPPARSARRPGRSTVARRTPGGQRSTAERGAPTGSDRAPPGAERPGRAANAGGARGQSRSPALESVSQLTGGVPRRRTETRPGVGHAASSSSSRIEAGSGRSDSTNSACHRVICVTDLAGRPAVVCGGVVRKRPQRRQVDRRGRRLYVLAGQQFPEWLSNRFDLARTT